MLGRCTVERFPDGEVNVRLQEPVRGREVILVQSTCPPVNDSLMELLCLADACRRSAALSVTAVVPYFGYARSDKRRGGRAPIAASMVAAMMEAVGIGHVVTVDLHAAQIEGFFHIPVDDLSAVPALAQALAARLPSGTVVVSPDEGRFKAATEYGRLLGAPVAILYKCRQNGASTRAGQVAGQVQDRPCLLIDDMISTGGTLAGAIEALLQAGARPEIYVAATHGLFVGGARAKLSHPAIQALYVTDSVPVAPGDWPVLRVVSLAPLLAVAIRHLWTGQLLAELYERPIAGAASESAGY
jgi:ribose-phosphate pyrophosphokinase